MLKSQARIMDFPLVLITIHVFVVSNGFFFKKERERKREGRKKNTGEQDLLSRDKTT